MSFFTLSAEILQLFYCILFLRRRKVWIYSVRRFLHEHPLYLSTEMLSISMCREIEEIGNLIVLTQWKILITFAYMLGWPAESSTCLVFALYRSSTGKSLRHKKSLISMYFTISRISLGYCRLEWWYSVCIPLH